MLTDVAGNVPCRTSSLMTFSWGLEDRAASVSIPHSVLLERRGGYEDR